jgi:hypothetical protein
MRRADSGAVWRRLDLYASRENAAIVILSAKREESRGFSPFKGSVGILHPLKRVQNDKGTCFIARKKEDCTATDAPA